MNHPGRLLIAAAIDDELSLIIERLAPAGMVMTGNYPVITCDRGKQKVFILTAGPGPLYMAAALGTVIPAIRPALLMLTGCCGGFKEAGIKKGAVLIATEEIYTQLGAEDPAGKSPVIPVSFLPNRLPMDHDLAERAVRHLRQTEYFRDIQLRSGPFITVSMVTATRATAEKYHRFYSAVAENMEGFAAAAVCRLYEAPVIEVRAVSNFVGERNKESWQTATAFEHAQKAVLTLLEQEVLL
ncbi:MAG: futalosine hydrolase [Desulfobacteraceae bacterium 4484_190.1]|nr:MAG: futalosine hydrolase [Desulfobacteraceae bacterium 4484_190.1]